MLLITEKSFFITQKDLSFNSILIMAGYILKITKNHYVE